MAENSLGTLPKSGRTSARPARGCCCSATLDFAANTIDAYGRALEEYLSFSAAKEVSVITAAKDHIAAYVRDLTSRPNPRRAKVVVLDSGAGLANATLQQRITAIRLFYDYLMEEGLRSINPVGRGRYTPGKGFGGVRAIAVLFPGSRSCHGFQTMSNGKR